MAETTRTVRGTLISSLRILPVSEDTIFDFARRACGAQEDAEVHLIARPSVGYVLGKPGDWSENPDRQYSDLELFQERELIESGIKFSRSSGSMHCVLVVDATNCRCKADLDQCLHLLEHEEQTIQSWCGRFMFHSACFMRNGDMLSAREAIRYVRC